jgi:hypothetical protein
MKLIEHLDKNQQQFHEMSTQLRELKNIDNENVFQIKKIQTVQVPEMEGRQSNIQKALDDLDRDNQEILRQF